MLTGYKGYIGMVLTVLGHFNIFEKLGTNQHDAEVAIDGLIQFLGFAFMVYGYVAAKIRLLEDGKKTDAVTEVIANTVK